MITTALTSSCHWKTLVPFCLRKKRPENAFLTLFKIFKIYSHNSELLQNRKEKQIMPFKTALNWLFNDI